MMKKYKALSATVFGMSMIEGNNAATKFYTGLPSWGMFLHIYMFLSLFVTPSKSVQLDVELLAVLVLRLNLFTVDLASRLGISNGTMVNIFQKEVVECYVCEAKIPNNMPSREILQNNMPLVFQQLYPNCRVIIDYSEIFTETPTSLDARAKTYSNYRCSNYKKQNTVKFLIGVTPCGTISWSCVR